MTEKDSMNVMAELEKELGVESSDLGLVTPKELLELSESLRQIEEQHVGEDEHIRDYVDLGRKVKVIGKAVSISRNDDQDNPLREQGRIAGNEAFVSTSVFNTEELVEDELKVYEGGIGYQNGVVRMKLNPDEDAERQLYVGDEERMTNNLTVEKHGDQDFRIFSSEDAEFKVDEEAMEATVENAKVSREKLSGVVSAVYQAGIIQRDIESGKPKHSVDDVEGKTFQPELRGKVRIDDKIVVLNNSVMQDMYDADVSEEEVANDLLLKEVEVTYLAPEDEEEEENDDDGEFDNYVNRVVSVDVEEDVVESVEDSDMVVLDGNKYQDLGQDELEVGEDGDVMEVAVPAVVSGIDTYGDDDKGRWARFDVRTLDNRDIPAVSDEESQTQAFNAVNGASSEFPAIASGYLSWQEVEDEENDETRGYAEFRVTGVITDVSKSMMKSLYKQA